MMEVFELVVIVDTRLEHALVNTTYRAYPVIRKILKCCSRCDAMFRIALFGIICVAAWITKILLHNHFPFLLDYYSKYSKMGMLN